MSPRARKLKPKKEPPSRAQRAQIDKMVRLEEELAEFINGTSTLGSVTRAFQAARKNPYGHFMCPFYGHCPGMRKKPPKE